MSDDKQLRAPTVLDEGLGKRFGVATAIAVVLNLFLWSSVASAIRSIPHYRVIPVEITRVVIDQKTGKKTVKVVTKKQIEKKIQKVRKQVIRRPPPKPEITKAPPPPQPRPAAHKPPPEGAHNKIITANVKPDTPVKPDEPTVLPGGNADVGKPIDTQNAGAAKVNPPEVVKPTPAPEKPKPDPIPTPAPEKPKPDPIPTPAPEKPKPDPVPTPTPVPEKPKRRGPSREADPVDQVKPEIPDDLKKGNYKSFVRVKVEVDEDGSATPILRTSSGNDEIDRRVLEALKRWRWKPALKDGEPVKSTQLFKFEFVVE